MSVDFAAGGNNLAEAAVVTGKKKKGALHLHPTMVLCNVKTRGGEEYNVSAHLEPLPFLLALWMGSRGWRGGRGGGGGGGKIAL